MPSPQVIVAQIGARRHYAVPRIYFDAGMLAGLFTDLCATKGWPRLVRTCVPARLQPAGLRRLCSRIPHGVPADKITSFGRLGLDIYRRRRKVSSVAEGIDLDLWAGSALCSAIVASGLPAVDLVHAFCPGGLELVRESKKRGMRGIVEQTNAPAAVVTRIISEENSRFAGYIVHPEKNDLWKKLADREYAEWEAADRIVCASQFVLDGIRQVGGPVEKVVVVPSGVEVPRAPVIRRKRKPGSGIHVLFVGRVDLRKGAHYLIEAARMLKGTDVSIRICGPNFLTPEALKDLPPNLTLTGRITRSEVARQYEWADIFCLPTLCEGSAMVNYEAMAMGLPVITTPNAGSIVQDGVNGYVFRARDAGAIVEAIEKCRVKMDDSGIPFPLWAESPPDYSLEAYGNRLIEAARGVLSQK
ncbi:MAG: glycosyltransferase family 4 protein [Planctomycetota bacterium]